MTEPVPAASGLLLSIIIPVLNEAPLIESQLQRLQILRNYSCEIIVADGGSSDATIDKSLPLVDRLIEAPKGRAAQMNAAAAVAKGQWLLFLHADSVLPDDFSRFLKNLAATTMPWGFFAIALSGHALGLRIIERAMNCRSRLTAVATGDQCLFFRRDFFQAINGYDDIPLMEDVAISKRSKKIAKPLVWPAAVMTSSRRWEQHGLLATVLLMWQLRLGYFLGISPQRLVKYYYGR
ncbi:TIGR04283 family arsenosugar biosynthesis glycosyltransferase [Oceanicoccus sp. KOV_DT_Chl]|uniref:TIGR04283 family arsenosugar biosynthesis glycosyltransferase n=1 Tax=Oceanicoccus sp. KOV_DT_Chl TaxID=1904639 RepID=UPI000C7DC8D3|nr:TIGR04283 family arsenosugar biosynthesis glycosyltransferase [Oceanicoccus sp. KOV_DT_Chl]